MTSLQIPAGIAMPCPFANPIDGTEASVTEVSPTSAENTVNFPRGFGATYGVSGSNGGKYVTRAEMNGFGKAMSTDIFRYKSGALNEFDELFVAATGGYAKDAIIDYLAPNSYKLFKIISLHDNNTFNPKTGGVNGMDWQYLNVEGVNPPDGRTVLFTFPDVKVDGATYVTYNNIRIMRSILISVIQANQNGYVVFDGTLTDSKTTEQGSDGRDLAYGYSIVMFEGNTLESISSKNPVSNQGIDLYNGGDNGLYGGDLSSPSSTYKFPSVYAIQAEKFYSFWLIANNTTISNSSMRGVLQTP